MAEFASKGVAGTGLGLGIAGTALGLLNNNGNGVLGGILGGGNQNMVSALQAENSMLKAENYSDKNAKEVYAQSLADNRRLRDEAFAFIKPIADESANNRVELARLQEQLKCCCEKQELREQIVLGKVNELALTTQAKFGCVDGTIANIMGTLGNITKTIVPASAICPAPMPQYNSWVAPANEAYDVTVKLGFSGLPVGTNITLTLKKNGTEVVATQQFSGVTNTITMDKAQVILAERDKLSCTIDFGNVPASGLIVPARSYLRVDNHGSVLAKRSADFVFNTLANMVFYSGVEARLQLDEARKPALVVDTWNTK